jgi:hypothetical protein
MMARISPKGRRYFQGGTGARDTISAQKVLFSGNFFRVILLLLFKNAVFFRLNAFCAIFLAVARRHTDRNNVGRQRRPPERG